MIHTSARGDVVRDGDGAFPRRRIVTLFLVALGVRWAYAFATLAFFGLDGFKFGDSHGYLATAERFAAAIAAGNVAGWGWLGPEPGLMPLFTWSLTAHVAMAGPWAPFTYVLAQGVLDAGTCVAIFGIARALDARVAILAGYAAAFTPTLVALSGIVYTDTPFTFFATLSLLGAALWLHRPSWRFAVLTGAMLGCAALVRVWIVPWVGPLLLLLAAAAWFRKRRGAGRLLQLVAIAAILGALVAPILARNASMHGAWSLTPQSGVHLAMWVVPLIREAQDGTPRTATVAALEARMRDRFGSDVSRNPFVQSNRYREIAVEELGRFGIGAIAKAWLYGAAINLASPAVTMVPAVARLPRTGFYDTPGRSFAEKVEAFLFRSSNVLYAWLLTLGIAGVLVVRLVQAAGGVMLLSSGPARWPLLLLLGWAGYVLAINGPIASPKYRLPIEPALAILGAAALARFAGRRLARFSTTV